MAFISKPTLVFLAAAPWCALAVPAAAQAQQEVREMQLRANVVQGCNVTAQPLIFSVPIGTTGRVRSTTSVVLTCTPNVAYEVSIDHGDHALGVNRRMRNATANAYVRYAIYRNASYSQVWSDKKNQRVSGNSGASGRQTLTAYGEATLNGVVQSGTYRDTVTVTVNY